MESKCTHFNAKRIAGRKGLTLWGGSSIELACHHDWALVLSAVGLRPFTEPPVKVNEGAKALLPDTLYNLPPPPGVDLDWPDRGTPRLSREWWEELADNLSKIKGKVGLCCAGGHGRTGTAAVILCSLLGFTPKTRKLGP
jgi:hypothetical protein